MDHLKIIILIICFTLTSVVIYRQPSSKAVQKNITLSQALSDIKGWTNNGLSPLDTRIIKSLELDDYINNSYSIGNKIVNLYIGYYLTSKKVGAAHSPLVCFPGQGWLISDKEEGTLSIRNRNIHYSRIIISKGDKKEVVVYWFQAFDRTFPGTFFQKIYTLLAKSFYSREDNAFVRVSVPIDGRKTDEAFLVAKDFVNASYPLLFTYITGKSVEQ